MGNIFEGALIPRSVDRPCSLSSAKSSIPHPIRRDHLTIQHVRWGRYTVTLWTFFCANKLWSWEGINRFNINRSNPKTNPEMIDMPVVGEVRMNSYISINFKQDGFQVDESNGTAKDSMLLKQINPTVEIQLADDKVNLDRAVSTTPSFVEIKYTMKELKSVLNALKQREWNYDGYG